MAKNTVVNRKSWIPAFAGMTRLKEVGIPPSSATSPGVALPPASMLS
ncbi:MAG: hypothetical protein ACKVHQ_07060 [Gammaproteobacteria bacterium]